MKTTELQQYLKANLAAFSKKGTKWEVVIGLYSTRPHATFTSGKEAEQYVATYNSNLKIPQ